MSQLSLVEAGYGISFGPYMHNDCFWTIRASEDRAQV